MMRTKAIFLTCIFVFTVMGIGVCGSEYSMDSFFGKWDVEKWLGVTGYQTEIITLGTSLISYPLRFPGQSR